MFWWRYMYSQLTAGKLLSGPKQEAGWFLAAGKCIWTLTMSTHTHTHSVSTVSILDVLTESHWQNQTAAMTEKIYTTYHSEEKYKHKWADILTSYTRGGLWCNLITDLNAVLERGAWFIKNLWSRKMISQMAPICWKGNLSWDRATCPACDQQMALLLHLWTAFRPLLRSRYQKLPGILTNMHLLAVLCLVKPQAAAIYQLPNIFNIDLKKVFTPHFSYKSSVVVSP